MPGLEVRKLSPAATVATKPIADPTAAGQYSCKIQYANMAKKAPAATHSGAVGQCPECGASPVSCVASTACGTEPLTCATMTLMLSGPPRKLARSTSVSVASSEFMQYKIAPISSSVTGPLSPSLQIKNLSPDSAEYGPSRSICTEACGPSDRVITFLGMYEGTSASVI